MSNKISNNRFPGIYREQSQLLSCSGRLRKRSDKHGLIELSEDQTWN